MTKIAIETVDAHLAATVFAEPGGEAGSDCEERFSLLCKAAFDGVLVHENGVIVEVNEKCCRMFGCEAEAMIARSILDFTAPHMRRTVVTAVRRNQGEPFESVGVKANGELFPLEVCGVSRRGSRIRIVALRDLTAQKKAEADQRERERQLRLLAQAAFDGVIVSENGVVLEANEAVADMLGYMTEELPGRKLTQFIDTAAHPSLTRDARETSRLREARARRKDGGSLYVELSSAALGGGRHIVAFRDVTARREAEQRLVERESRYRDLVEHGHDLLCSHDFDGRITAANVPAAHILGISVAELHTLNVRDILHPDFRSQFDDYVEAVRRDGMAEGKMKVMTRDGRVRIWEYRNTVRRIGLAVPEVRGLARDVTEREEALRAVKRSEEHFRSIIENASDVIGILDSVGMIRYHSPSLERSLGFSSAELTGSRLLDYVHPEDRGRVAEFILQQSTGRTDAGTIKVRLTQRCGTYRSFEVVAKNLLRDGDVHSIIINARDVTERELLERQLEQANRLTGLGRLAATVAHEFNNVLMGMQPFAELLQRADVSPAVLEKCGSHIASSIQRGKGVALDILRFTQPAAPVFQRVHLGQWWRELEPEIRAQLGNHISFVATFPDDVEVMADGGQLAQVFANLVSNARDAMPRSGSLTISARLPVAGESFPFGSIPDPESFVQISVADTGSGMPSEVIGHVFDPLFTTKESGGTGLGLAVVHQVATRHGGYVFVESHVGRGSVFHVFIPVVTTSAQENERERAAPGAVRASRLLLVDDEELIVEGITQLLECEGIEVRAVFRGSEAVDAAEEFDPQIVLLDVGLPDVGGHEVARRLRAGRPTLPIIFATGHGDPQRIELDEYTCFLQKPFDFDVLLETIARLEQRNAGEA